MTTSAAPQNPTGITLFLSGDVMTGRGVDQILPHPGDPVLHESYVKDARHYVELAETANGPIPVPAPYDYVWGVALEELGRRDPDIRLVNLETSITQSPDFWRGKEVLYRMEPRNLPVLRAAGIGCVSLANNHTLDWGFRGLEETLKSLEAAKIPFVGAGRNLAEAMQPVRFDTGGTRVRIFGLGMPDCGIPEAWTATGAGAGLFRLADYSLQSLETVKRAMAHHTAPGDLVVVSIHWGGNWGYAIPLAHREFARGLVDACGVDVVHGHSSHHVKGLEVYHGKLILYGCGDLITDYEGISGQESYRGDLGLLYFVSLVPNGDLKSLEMVPTRMKRLQLTRPGEADMAWLQGILERELKKEGLALERRPANTFRLAF